MDGLSSQRTGIHARVRAGWVGAALFRCVCGTRRRVTGKRTRPGDGSAHCRAVVHLVVRRDLHDGEHGAVEKCVLNPSSRCLSAPRVPQRDLVHAPLTSRHTHHLTSTVGSPLEHTAACRGTPGHDGRADGDVPAVHDRRLRGVAVRRAELMHRLLLGKDCGRCCGKRGRRVMPRQRETARSVACLSRRTETRRWAAAHRGPRSALGVAAQPGSRAGLGACRPTWGRARGL